MAKARIGIIGTGWWATESHMPGVLSHDDAELVAVCDTDPARLAAAATAYGVGRTYADYGEMLDRESLDAAIVVTPHATHYDITRTCLARGLHVLLEKPMTLSASHARSLVDLAGGSKLELLIGYPYHYQPQNLRARGVLQSGELGAIQYVTCSYSTDVRGFLAGDVRPDHSPIPTYAVHGPGTGYNEPQLLGGGQGHLQITHSAALMFFVTGLRAESVHALMRNHSLAVDLVDVYSVAFEGSAIGMVGGTGNAGRNHRLALAVYCEDGCFVSDTLAGVSQVRRRDGTVEDLISAERPDRFATTRNFIDVVLGRAPNGSPGEVGWRTVELLDAAYRSAAAGGAGVDIAELYH
jgi:predicted dehydrogenase